MKNYPFAGAWHVTMVQMGHDSDNQDLRELAWQQVLEAQKMWKNLIGWLVDHVDERWQIELKPTNVFTWSSGCFHLTMFSPVDTIKLKAYDMSVFDDEDGKSKIFRGDETPEAPAVEFELPPGGQEFFEYLKGYKVTVFGRCLKCGKVFFNRTRRSKKYCSLPCQRAAGMQRVRARKKVQVQQTQKE